MAEFGEVHAHLHEMAKNLQPEFMEAYELAMKSAINTCIIFRGVIGRFMRNFGSQLGITIGPDGKITTKCIFCPMHCRFNTPSSAGRRAAEDGKLYKVPAPAYALKRDRKKKQSIDLPGEKAGCSPKDVEPRIKKTKK